MESATVHIQRKNGVISSVKIVMPVWISNSANNSHIDIKIPLLQIDTFVDDESEMDEAINEVVTNFIIFSEKHGGSLENQLELMGWKKEESSILNLDSVGTPFEAIMETGTEKSLQIHLPIAA